MRNNRKTTLLRVFAVSMAILFAGSVCTACGSSNDDTSNSTGDASGNKEGQQTDAGNGSEEDSSDQPDQGATVSDSDIGQDAALDQEEETEIQVFIAASLQTVMTQLAENYNKEHPQVKITYHADSSGTLLTQIQEGYECDIFFSAAVKQIDQLETDGLVVEGTRADAVNNQVVVVTRKDSGTKVTGLSDLGNAKSIALAGGSVPVGRYTRVALTNLGILEEAEDAALVTTQQVSDALGGVEISEQDNVSKVLLAVVEDSSEVGTVYYSDTYGYEDDLDILETVSYDLTGNVIYPVAQVVNSEADDTQTKAAADFIAYILSDEAKAVFEDFYYDPIE